jgi:hypothetical protein
MSGNDQWINGGETLTPLASSPGGSFLGAACCLRGSGWPPS